MQVFSIFSINKLMTRRPKKIPSWVQYLYVITWFCYCSCLLLLAGFACSIQVTWRLVFSRAPRPVKWNLLLNLKRSVHHQLPTFKWPYCPSLPGCQKLNVNMLVNIISKSRNWWCTICLWLHGAVHAVTTYIRDSVEFRLVCAKKFSRNFKVVSLNCASFSSNFRVSISSIAMNSMP